jgi:uncharacterized protein
VRIQKESEHQVMPWANGKGETLEIVAQPSGPHWDWRLSVASVSVDGDFSHLPGVDRVLIVAAGVGMDLTIDGAASRVKRFESISFSGDADVQCALLEGAVRDLNLMCRRSSGVTKTMTIELVDARDGVETGGVIVVLSGVLFVSTPGAVFPFTPQKVRVQNFDALFGEPDDELTIVAATQAVVARIR